MACKKQRVDSVVADLKLKKVSSHRLNEINTSRITKSPKLASENYNKRKKRKFTYQKPLLDDSKLKNFSQDSLSDNKSVSKKRKKEPQVKVKLNFKRKPGKDEHQKKDHPKIIDNIEHENMPSISACDICKISISDAVLHCNLSLKEYHPYCAHPMCNFPDKFPNQIYVCPNCIHNNNSSFHHFV